MRPHAAVLRNARRLLRRGGGAASRDNKLTPAEYEETTWSARSWTTFAAQKISVALHYAAAFEISMALRVPKFDQAELDAAAARRMAGGG